MTSSPIHCRVSVARFVKANAWGPAHASLLLALWCSQPDPFAWSPTVSASVPMLSRVLGCSENYVAKLIVDLVAGGAVVRTKTDRVRRYKLLRPEHVVEDAEENPYPNPSTPNPSTLAPASTPTRTRARACQPNKPVDHEAEVTRRRKRDEQQRSRSQALTKLGLRRSQITERLTKTFGLAANELRYDGEETNAAIDWMVSNGESIKEFDTVLQLARLDSEKPEHPERLFFSSHSAWLAKVCAP